MHRIFYFISVLAYSTLVLTSMSLQAQNTDNPYHPDFRLTQLMDQATLEQINSEKPELILYYNYYLDHSFYVVNLRQEKPVEGTDIRTVNKIDPDGNQVGKFSEKTYDPQQFNVMKYDFPRELDRFVTYVWQDAGIALVFIPQRHFQANFQDYIKNINASR